MNIKIPVYEPFLTGNEKKYVDECLDTNWISSKGKFVQLFENKFSEYINVNHSLTVSNGTVALHLALVTIGLGPGDEIIVPTLTYIAPVNAITYTGATPVFVDSLPGSWQMNPDDIRRKINNNTKAILAVHLYGHPCEMDTIRDICNQHDLFLIEDCAEAFGSLYKGKHVGTFGDIATFSFYGNKTITTGEGGMVTTNDTTLYERAIHFKGQGLAKYREYWHDVIGYNYRMTNICAAIGLAQLEKVELIIDKKLKIANWYREAFANTDIEFHQSVGDVRHSYWICSILTKTQSARDPLRNYLAKHGVETRPVFYPVHTMPMYSKKFEKHHIAEDIGWRGINLPSYPALKSEELEYVCQIINDFTKNEDYRNNI